jgi:phosphoesterase RecJ-like protein
MSPKKRKSNKRIGKQKAETDYGVLLQRTRRYKVHKERQNYLFVVLCVPRAFVSFVVLFSSLMFLLSIIPIPHLTPFPMLPEIISRIESAASILIFSHINPDGDAIGSALGLWWVLQAQGKTVAVSFADPAPESLRFLPGIEEIRPRAWDGAALVLCVDGSDAERYGAEYTAARAAGAAVITIDHHKTNTLFGDLNWVDSQYVATAQMIYALTRHAGWTLSPEAATCLATGCVTDSNGFSTDHTTPDVLETVADLMRAGASLSTIMYYVRGLRSRADALMWGKILSNLQIDGGVAWAVSYAADRAVVGADENAAGGVSGFVRDIEGVQIGILFTEVEPRLVRLSMRSTKAYDVSTIALELGGGGHRQAAGATVESSVQEAVAMVVAKAKALVQG